MQFDAFDPENHVSWFNNRIYPKVNHFTYNRYWFLLALIRSVSVKVCERDNILVSITCDTENNNVKPLEDSLEQCILLYTLMYTQSAWNGLPCQSRQRL